MSMQRGGGLAAALLIFMLNVDPKVSATIIHVSVTPTLKLTRVLLKLLEWRLLHMLHMLRMLQSGVHLSRICSSGREASISIVLLYVQTQ